MSGALLVHDVDRGQPLGRPGAGGRLQLPALGLFLEARLHALRGHHLVLELAPGFDHHLPVFALVGRPDRDGDDVAARVSHRQVELGAALGVRVLGDLQLFVRGLGARHRRPGAVVLVVLGLEVDFLALLHRAVGHHLHLHRGPVLGVLVVGVQVHPLLVRLSGGRPGELDRRDPLDLRLPFDAGVLAPLLVEQEVGRLPLHLDRSGKGEPPDDLAVLVGLAQDVGGLLVVLLAGILDARHRSFVGVVVLVLGEDLHFLGPDVDLLGEVGERLSVQLDVIMQLAHQGGLVRALGLLPLAFGLAAPGVELGLGAADLLALLVEDELHFLHVLELLALESGGAAHRIVGPDVDDVRHALPRKIGPVQCGSGFPVT